MAAQVAELSAAGCAKVISETASDARTKRPQLKRAIAELGEGDVLVVTRHDRRAVNFLSGVHMAASMILLN